jgi:hypothetical protein
MSDATRARPRYVTWRRVVQQNLGPPPPRLRAMYAYCDGLDPDGTTPATRSCRSLAYWLRSRREYLRPRAGKSDRGDPPAPNPSPPRAITTSVREWIDVLVIRDGMLLSHRDFTDDLCHPGAARVVLVGPGQDAAAVGETAPAELRRRLATDPQPQGDAP